MKYLFILLTVLAFSCKKEAIEHHIHIEYQSSDSINYINYQIGTAGRGRYNFTIKDSTWSKDTTIYGSQSINFTGSPHNEGASITSKLFIDGELVDYCSIPYYDKGNVEVSIFHLGGSTN